MKTGNRIFKKSVSTSLPANIPIIFWDTCGLLKILHIPEENRREDVIRLTEHFEWILDKIKNNEILSVTSEMVITELEQHLSEVVDKLSQNQDISRNNFLKFVELTSPDRKKTSYKNVINKISIVQRLDKIVRDIVRHTYILKEHLDFTKNAHFRVKNKIAPAARKSEYKDCYIWSSFLHVINSIDPNTKVVFYTDNKQDYFFNNTICADIATDLHGKNSKVILKIAESRWLI